MKKQAVGVTLAALSFLLLFRIGLSESEENYSSKFVGPQVRDYKYRYSYTEHPNTEHPNTEDPNTEDPNTENPNTEDPNTQDPSAEDPDTVINILEKDCKGFHLRFNFSDTTTLGLGKDFLSSPNITCLSFERNGIESVASGAFASLPDLEYLNLAGNFISSLFSFNGHNHLKTLILANQSMHSAYEDRTLEVSGKYPELRYLDLSGNRIHLITRASDDQNFYNLFSRKCLFPKLRYLDLSRNNLVTFDNSILFNCNITNVHLKNNNLNFVDLRDYKHFVELRLDNNNFHRIGDYNAYYAPNMYGYENKVNQYIVLINEMPRLKYFSISNNQINYLDTNIFTKMPELVTLDLSNNKIKGTFIVTNDVFVSLKNINLNNNELFSISISHRLSNLSILSMTHNKLQKVVSNFVDAPILKKLYLSNNRINLIDENAFSNLKFLEELHLDNNNLDKLPIEWSYNLNNLRYLNLSNNKFKTLESLSLSESMPIIKIYLLKNHIVYMKAEVMRNVPKNATIYFLPESENNMHNLKEICMLL